MKNYPDFAAPYFTHAQIWNWFPFLCVWEWARLRSAKSKVQARQQCAGCGRRRVRVWCDIISEHSLDLPVAKCVRLFTCK